MFDGAGIQLPWHAAGTPAPDRASDVGRDNLIIALLPLLASLLTVAAVSIPCCAPGDAASYRRSQPLLLPELLQRLRVAIRIDRAVWIRIVSIGFSLFWACAVLSDTLLVQRPVFTVLYDRQQWMHKLSFSEWFGATVSTVGSNNLVVTTAKEKCADDCSHSPKLCAKLYPASCSPRLHHLKFHWSLHSGHSCPEFASGNAARPRGLEQAKDACTAIEQSGDGHCSAVVCPRNARTGCTLRSSKDPVKFSQEDCYVLITRNVSMFSELYLDPSLPPAKPLPPSLPMQNSAQAPFSEPDLAAKLTHLGDYGIWRATQVDLAYADSHVWVMRRSTSWQPVCEHTLLKDSSANRSRWSPCAATTSAQRV